MGLLDNMFGGGRNERAEDQTSKEMDGTTYFDENEERQGQSTYDEATGQPYRNDRDWKAPEVGENLDNGDDQALQALLERYQNPESAEDMLSPEEEEMLRKARLID